MTIYDITTTYFKGDKIRFQGKIFKSKKDGNIGHIPIGNKFDRYWKEE